MRHAFRALVCTLAAAGCRSGAPVWERAPLAPTLRLGEAVGLGEVVVLAVDAHAGTALGAGAGVAFLTGVAAAPGRWVERADSSGRIRFRGVPAGAYEVRVRGIGYEDWRDTVAVSDRAGWVALVQLRRRPVRLVPVIAGTEHP
jgi:hypothetical protein